MLRTSAKVAAMPPGPLRERGLDHLYQGQSNDCYWHGLFGGIYLSHMRLATFAHLIAAEDAADLVAREAGEAVDGAALLDVDLDGVDEVLLSSPGQVISLKPAEGAGIGSWDVRAARHALTAVLRRRPEAYHARLVAFEEAEGAEAAEGGGAGAGGSAASIHDLVRTREPGLAARLHYDGYERRSGLVHLLPEDTTPGEYATSAFRELGDFVDQPFTLDELKADCVTLTRDGQLMTPEGPQPLRVRKTVRFDGQRRAPRLTFEVEVHNPGGRPLAARMAVEWSLKLLGGGGNPAASYRIGGVRSSHDGSGTMPGVILVEAGNRDVGVDLATTLQPAADAWWYSIDTVSLSEDGYERTHQGSSLSFMWPLRLAAGETAAFEIDHRITTSVDRAVEEGS